MKLNYRTITRKTAREMLSHYVRYCERCGLIEPFRQVRKLDPVEDLVKELNNQLQKLFADVDKKFLAEMERRGVIALTDAERKGMVDKILSPILQDMDRLVAEMGTQAAEMGRQRTLRQLRSSGMKVTFEAFSESAHRALQERILQFSARTSARIAGDVAENLLTSFENGLGTAQAASQLEKVFEGMQRYELERIARTEINSAQNEGVNATYQENGIQYVMWISAQDDRVRSYDKGDEADHVILHGEVIQAGETFSNGLRYPMDRSGPLAEIINCRCRTKPYFPEEGELIDETPYYPDRGKRFAKEPGPTGGQQEGGGGAAGIPGTPAAEELRGASMFPEGFKYRTMKNDLPPVMEGIKAGRPDWFAGGYLNAGVLSSGQRAYAEANFKNIIVKESRSKGFLMRTNTMGEFEVSSHNFTVNQGYNSTFPNQVYNPKKELDSAMKKLANGETLSRAEEEAVESLWHEILHNRAQGAEMGYSKGQVWSQSVELVNEWVARQSYGDFMEQTFGVAAQHKASIVKGAQGYQHMLNSFNAALRELGIDADDIFPAIDKINQYGKWRAHPELLGKALAKHSPKIQETIKLAKGSLSKKALERELEKAMERVGRVIAGGVPERNIPTLIKQVIDQAIQNAGVTP